jgi:hypothetical protein
VPRGTDVEPTGFVPGKIPSPEAKMGFRVDDDCCFMPSGDKLRSPKATGHAEQTGQCSGVTWLFTRPANSKIGDSSRDQFREEPVSRRARQRHARRSTHGGEGGFTKLTLKVSPVVFGQPTRL